jgi:hypothetical protein
MIVLAALLPLFALRASFSSAESAGKRLTDKEIARLQEIVQELSEINREQEELLRSSELKISLLEETIKGQQSLLRRQKVYSVISSAGCLGLGFTGGCIYWGLR